MAPLSMLTGIAMSPAVDNRFPIFPKLFGSRQGARSIHFTLVMGYLCFLAVHVGLVAITGFVRNMNVLLRQSCVTVFRPIPSRGGIGRCLPSRLNPGRA